MSKKRPPEPEMCDYAECDEVSEVVQVVEAYMGNAQSSRSLKVVRKNDSGTDVLSVEITPK